MEYKNNRIISNARSVKLQPINKKQMAELMGISMSTLKRQLKSANLTVNRGLISPMRQVEIYQTLGWAEKAPSESK